MHIDSFNRTYSFAILGMSLSVVFDNTNANDLMKSLLNILSEFEQSKDENYKPKMVNNPLSTDPFVGSPRGSLAFLQIQQNASATN